MTERHPGDRRGQGPRRPGRARDLPHAGADRGRVRRGGHAAVRASRWRARPWTTRRSTRTEAVAEAEVLEGSTIFRTLVRFTAAQRRRGVPELGVPYPRGLTPGTTVPVEYDVTDARARAGRGPHRAHRLRAAARRHRRHVADRAAGRPSDAPPLVGLAAAAARPGRVVGLTREPRRPRQGPARRRRDVRRRRPALRPHQHRAHRRARTAAGAALARAALDLRPGERVLDLAAGTAVSTVELARSGAWCVAADFSLGMLRAGRGARRSRRSPPTRSPCRSPTPCSTP